MLSLFPNNHFSKNPFMLLVFSHKENPSLLILKAIISIHLALPHIIPRGMYTMKRLFGWGGAFIATTDLVTKMSQEGEKHGNLSTSESESPSPSAAKIKPGRIRAGLRLTNYLSTYPASLSWSIEEFIFILSFVFNLFD